MQQIFFLFYNKYFAQITKLKIESNPFAKGFRDSSSHEGDDPFPGVYQAHPGLPGGMPGLDPFQHIRPPFGGPPGPAPAPAPPSAEDNNNMMLVAAEKARMMMMMNRAPLLPPAPPPAPPSLPLSPELLARYSLGLYNPALLAAMVRTSAAAPPLTSAASPFLPALSALSPKSPEPGAAKSPRFSPYTVPAPASVSRPSSSPSRLSTLSDGEAGRSPSPRSSPPPAPPPASRPPFPVHFS